MSVAVPTKAEQTAGTMNDLWGRDFGFLKVVNETTVARTISDADIGAYINCSNASAVTLTIPESTTAAGKVFPIGSTVIAFSNGAGGVTWAKTGSDTLTGTATAAQNIARKVTKVAATVWHAWV